MAIARKPKTQPIPDDAVNVDALIAKGGGVAQSSSTADTISAEEARRQSDTPTTSFTLRVPNEILIPLDAHRKNQSYKVPRQQWIIEAVVQRLEREALPTTKDE